MDESFLEGMTAHLFRRAQVIANGRAFRLAEEFATIILGQLNTAYSRLFPIRHTWNGR